MQMTTIELIFAVSGWIFGLISTICAIIQSVSKSKYKKLYKNQKASAGKESIISQIGGIKIDRK